VVLKAADTCGKDALVLLAEHRFTGQHPGELDVALEMAADELKRVSVEHKIDAVKAERIARVVALYHYEFGGPKLAGRALYKRLSLVNHSCNPNCQTSVGEEYSITVTMKAIRQGEQLTVNYKPKAVVPFHREVAQTNLFVMFGGALCRCNSGVFCVHHGQSVSQILKSTGGLVSPTRQQANNCFLATAAPAKQILHLLKEANTKPSSRTVCHMEMALVICLFDAIQRAGGVAADDVPVIVGAISSLLARHNQEDINSVPSDVLCLLDQYLQLLSFDRAPIHGRFCPTIPPRVLHIISFGIQQ
jgi:hypothetical protein